MPTANYQLGVDAAIVLKYGDADQSVIKGLNQLGLPELMREVIKISEFRTDFAVEFTGEGSHGRITYGGNMVLGDTKGQDQLKDYIKNNTKFTDCRLYLDLTNFMAPDLANDSAASFQVSKHSPGQANKNGTFPFSGEMVTNGLYCYFVAHIVDGSSPTLSFDNTDNSINDTGSGFVTAGFAAGQTLIVEGSPNGTNDGQHLIESVAAGKIIVTSDTTIGTESAAAGTTLHGGKL